MVTIDKIYIIPKKIWRWRSAGILSAAFGSHCLELQLTLIHESVCSIKYRMHVGVAGRIKIRDTGGNNDVI